MTLEYRSFSFAPAAGSETRAADVAGDKLAGHAIVYNRDSHDLGGFIERVDPGALTRSLDAAAAGGLNIFAFWSHDSSQPLGSTRGGKLKLASDADGLAFELDTTRFTPAQLDAARENELRMSFGFRVVKDSWTYRDDGVAERTLLDVDLFEVSPVVSPAYPDTTAALRSLEAWKASETPWTGETIKGVPLTITEMHERFGATSMAVRDDFVDSRFTGEATTTLLQSVVRDNPEATLKENAALNIKRNLMLKAIEHHIARLPQV